MKAICPKCNEVIDLDDLIICDEEVDCCDEFEQADQENEEKKLHSFNEDE